MTHARSWADEYLRMVSDCQRRDSKMSEWEQQFVADMKKRLDRRQLPTPNQLEKLNDVWERVTANG